MISVFLPTRARSNAFMMSTASLIGNASQPDELEILAAMDPDDDIAAYELDFLAPQVRAWVAPQRFGYARLHEYVNFLAGVARGDLFMLWNDDAEMITRGWDAVVTKAAEDRPGVLWMQANHDEGGNLFPVWPRSWYKVMGYVSRSPNIDVWISELGRRLGRETQVPVRLLHHRPDVTGTPADETFREGRAVMGPLNDPEYDSQANRVARTRAVRAIGRLYCAGA